MSNFGTQHAKQEINRRSESSRTFSPGCVFLALAVLLLLFVLFLYPAIKSSLVSAENMARLFEMAELERALEFYVEEIGEIPPNATLEAIELHVRNSTHRPLGANSKFDNFAHDIRTIDDREAIVFWLGGDAWHSIASNSHHCNYFQFPAERLTDVDNDGWPEFRDRDGNFFLMRNGKVLLYNVTTKSEYSFDELNISGRETEN